MKKHVSRSDDLLRVLKFLANQENKVQNMQIYKELGLNRKKSQLILKALIEQGFVIKDSGCPCGYIFNQHFREFKNENQ